MVTTTRKLDHSQASMDNQALLELEKSIGYLSDPDEPEIPDTPQVQQDFQGVTLTEEQEDALSEYEEQRDTVDNAYNEFQGATEDLREAYRTIVKAFGFIPAH